MNSTVAIGWVEENEQRKKIPTSGKKKAYALRNLSLDEQASIFSKIINPPERRLLIYSDNGVNLFVERENIEVQPYIIHFGARFERVFTITLEIKSQALGTREHKISIRTPSTLWYVLYGYTIEEDELKRLMQIFKY